MKGERLGSRLVLGGALSTFVGTLAAFLASVAPVRATDCYYDGVYGIGPNCQEETMNGQWTSCSECAYEMCWMFGGEDYQCVNSCIAGSWQSGCS